MSLVCWESILSACSHSCHSFWKFFTALTIFHTDLLLVVDATFSMKHMLTNLELQIFIANYSSADQLINDINITAWLVLLFQADNNMSMW